MVKNNTENVTQRGNRDAGQAGSERGGKVQGPGRLSLPSSSFLGLFALCVMHPWRKWTVGRWHHPQLQDGFTS